MIVILAGGDPRSLAVQDLLGLYSETLSQKNKLSEGWEDNSAV